MLLNRSQVIVTATIMNVDGDLGMMMCITRHKLAQEATSQRCKYAHANNSDFRTTCGKRHFLRYFELIQCGTRIREKPLTGICKPHTAPTAFEQRDAKLIFKPTDASTHTGLTDL